MVIETFKPGMVSQVYDRLETKGRLFPAGVKYVDSWVSQDLRVCYQVMSCDDSTLIDQWIANWKDLTDFEVIPVMKSDEARERITRFE